VLGAELEVVDWLELVDSLGLVTGASDSVVVDELPGAVVLLLLPQAAALSAASPRRSATSDFRIWVPRFVGAWVGPVWVGPPGRAAWARRHRSGARTVGEVSER
jgi:hypothetical protein